MSVEFRVVQGKAKALGEIEAIKRRMKSPKPGWNAVGRYLAFEVNRQFVTRGRNFGTPWAPLAPATILEKRRKGYPSQPLVRTGKMKSGFAYPQLIINSRGSIATFGSNDPVAGYQHHGTRHIPSRKIAVATPRVRKEVRKIMARYVAEGKVR